MVSKTSKNKQAELNDFKRMYLSPLYRADWNKINLSAADSPEHNLMVCKICVYLVHRNIPFLTQARFRSGYRPDIFVPTGLPKKIIEVRYSETEKRSQAKNEYIPDVFLNEIMFVDAKQEFNEKMIL